MWYPYLILWAPHLLLYRLGFKPWQVWIGASPIVPLLLALAFRNLWWVYATPLWMLTGSALGTLLCNGVAHSFGWRRP